ncbi:UDP-N-acetylglucosamine 1-carboxyvinyltransferase [Actinidia chinensis var. chinensis]|uniref:UDP-N-acetylglucosamine 1-carboxyvinyltransferase n=1 Tax=Actinidia chinensis var. chinensis TaxID=1590841 RepID=A0A2R6PTS1_ACTCC|nr:UDP-N-acetylglucosamine 1-carboxyvinyltransferase [Actinidia chinensis var. chinensis]
MASTPTPHSLSPPNPLPHLPETPHLTPTLQLPPKTLTATAPKLAVSGGHSLAGHVTISGSKNSSLPILAATLCCSGDTKLKNVPDLSDTRAMLSILGSLGAEIESFGGDVVVNTDRVGSVEPCLDLIGKIRGGFFVIGPLLGRFGEAVVGLPGGCDIGARPVDLYVRGLRALGAIVELRDGKIRAQAANGKGLVGGRFRFDYASVGATETLMMAACMADGETVLSNVAQEPEVVDLARFLIDNGACVEGAGTDKLVIKGRSRSLHGSEYTIIPDRIEAGTFMLAAAITRSCISMSPIVPSHVSCLINKLVTAGCKITRHTPDILEVSAIPAKIGDVLRGFDVKTSPFPGFPTDLQPQTTALLTTCDGLSVVEESVFENRMSYVTELQKFGPRIQVCGSTALVFGKDRASVLHGSQVVASDLRGGVSLVLAGLAAEGNTEIDGVAHIDRGYENLEMKLQLLGADVKRLIPAATAP